MPVFNGEKYLALSIESILKQSFKDFELIMVNDCSKDNSLYIMEKYAKMDSRIRIYNNPVNLGVAKSLNNGFDKACGEYFTWTSDDNLYAKSALDEMYKYLSENDRHFVFADMEIIGENNEKLNEVRLEAKDLYLNSAIGGCFMYSRTAGETVGEYTDKYPLLQDYEYWLRMDRQFEIHHIDKALYKYRSHSSNLTSNNHKRMNYELYMLRMEWMEYLFSHAENREKDKLYFDLTLQNPDKKAYFKRHAYGNNFPEHMEWTEHLCTRDKRPGILYGCGDFGKRALEYFGRENIAYFADGNKNNVGKNVEGIEVISFEKLAYIHKEYQVIISTAARVLPEIVENLLNIGIRDFTTYIQYTKDIRNME